MSEKTGIIGVGFNFFSSYKGGKRTVGDSFSTASIYSTDTYLMFCSNGGSPLSILEDCGHRVESKLMTTKANFVLSRKVFTVAIIILTNLGRMDITN